MFLISHQFQISLATVFNVGNRIPPFLLIYAKAVVLSILRRTLQSHDFFAKHLRPNNAAFNSNLLMSHFCSCLFQ